LAKNSEKLGPALTLRQPMHVGSGQLPLATRTYFAHHVHCNNVNQFHVLLS